MHRRLLALILILYCVAALLHALATPIMEAWDEPWHFPMVQYIATHGFTLPVQQPDVDAPYKQQGGQPPLYYLISAALIAPIDTSDMNTVRRMNPHASVGVAQPDGNANLIVHRPNLEAFPWRNTTLAVYVVRFFSILLGAGTILITYQLAREVFPQEPMIALGAAALNAFLPMFVFISASVSNDNLSNLLGSGLALLLVRLVKHERLPHLRSYMLLGIVTGAGLLSKLSIGFFIPVTAAVLLLLSLRFRRLQPLLIGGMVSGVLTLLIAGWWYVRNQQLYGDLTGLNVFLDIIGRRYPPANFAQLWTERFSFARSYWGAYGSINILLPDMLYTLFDAIGIVALVSVPLFLVKTEVRRERGTRQWQAAAVTLILPLLTFVSLLRWTTETPASQGRLIFVALSSLSMWLVVGWTWWVTNDWRRWIAGAIAFYFGLVTFAAPLFVIPPAYALPNTITPLPPTVTFSADDGTSVGLQNAQLMTNSVYPGEYVALQTDWEIMTPTAQDWSLFVHLVTPDGVIVGQRDVYPGGGKLATSDLSAGAVWANPLAVAVPRTAFAPNTLEVRIGWYNVADGARLQLQDGTESIGVGTVELLPYQSNLPNSLKVNFDGQIELVGYDLNRLSAAPGEPIELTLYWRGLQKIEQDYVVFANIIEPRTLTKYADSNAMPANWSRPTTGWQPGEIIEDKHTLTVYKDALPGIYEVEIGLYLQNGTFPRLRIVPEVGGNADNYLYLNRIRVLEPAP